MPIAVDIAEEILTLKRQRHAVILAHHYQEPEIQDLADAVGDSLELSRKAREMDGEVIAFCGVWFMAETAKVLSPQKIVIVPDREASCSLVEACTAAQVRAYRRAHPDDVIVSYINTSVEVKAESDILCTSRNAVEVVNSIPAGREVLFLPDRNLGAWVKRQTGRTNLKLWQGTCVVHATFTERRLLEALSQFPQAKVAAHPECPSGVLDRADFVGSTSAIIQWCAKPAARDIIVVTESGVAHSLRRVAPAKRFHFIANEECNCSECPYMKRNTLEKLRDALLTLSPRVEIPDDTIRRALVPLERMLAVTAR